MNSVFFYIVKMLLATRTLTHISAFETRAQPAQTAAVRAGVFPQHFSRPKCAGATVSSSATAL